MGKISSGSKTCKRSIKGINYYDGNIRVIFLTLLTNQRKDYIHKIVNAHTKNSRIFWIMLQKHFSKNSSAQWKALEKVGVLVLRIFGHTVSPKMHAYCIQKETFCIIQLKHFWRAQWKKILNIIERQISESHLNVWLSTVFTEFHQDVNCHATSRKEISNVSTTGFSGLQLVTLEKSRAGWIYSWQMS